MLTHLSRRLFCSAAAEIQSATISRTVNSLFRATTHSNPRILAPIVTTKVVREGVSIDFDCIGRAALSKALHAVAICNVKNPGDQVAYLKPSIAKDLKMDGEREIARGLTPFKLSLFPSLPPRSPLESHNVRRTKVSSNLDAEELAKNIHMCYMRRTPLVLECMGEKAMGIIGHAIALFNDRVKAHDMAAYLSVISGTSADGSELVKMEFQLIERPKTH